MAKAYLKNKKIILSFDKGIYGSLTEVNYEIGLEAIDFLWLEIGEIYSLLLDFSYKCIQSKLVNKILYENELNSLYKLSPYLHFHIQYLSEFIFVMLEYPKKSKKKREAICSFFHNLTDISFKSELRSPSFCLFSKCVKYNIKDVESYNKLFHYAICLLMADIQYKRRYLTDEIDFICNALNDTSNLSNTQKLYYIDSIRNDRKYINHSFKVSLQPNKDYASSNDKEIIKKEILSNELQLYQVYSVNCLYDLFRFDVINIVMSNKTINKCKYCGSYFIPKGKKNTYYCNRPDFWTNKTCKEIGPKAIYNKNKENNTIKKVYDRAYYKVYQRQRRSKPW